MLRIYMRRTICTSKVFQNSVCKKKLRLETQKLTGKMDQMNHVERALYYLTLASQNIQDEEQRHKLKRDALRAINKRFPLLFRLESTGDNFENFHKALKNTLKIKENMKLLTEKPMYTSPRDFTKILHQNVDPNMVEKLFKNQFKIKWHTKTGDPDQFSFYGFCQDALDATGKNVMMVKTRKAHVKSRLYHAQNKLREIRRTRQQLCPPVYVCTENDRRQVTWTKWKWDDEQQEFINEEDQGDEEENEEDKIGWISNTLLKNHIQNHSKRNEQGNLPNRARHLYWVVLEEDDDTIGNPGGRIETQIYVGIASNGIKDRWIENGTSHCRRMKWSRDVMCEMLNYDPNALKRVQLVDLRVLLHKAYNPNGENCGLFIMQYEGDLEEAERKILDDGVKIYTDGSWTWKPKNMHHGMNCRS